MKVIFLGRGELGIRTLKAILKEGHEVPLIISTRHTPEVGSSPREFEIIAKQNEIEYGFTTNLGAKWIKKFLEFNADIAVAIQWLNVIHREVIKTVKFGFLNVHCGDLPRYRGNATPNWNILMGETEAVLCVHYMDPDELDSGDIIGKARLSITSETTIGELYRFIVTQGPILVVEALRDIKTGNVNPEPQNHEKALRCYPRLPIDGEIDWNAPANKICGLVRSLSEPFDGAYTFLRGKKLKIWACRQVKPDMNFIGVTGQVAKLNSTESIYVITGHSGMVELIQVQLEGGNKVPPRKVINSIRIRLGMNFSEEISIIKRDMETLKNKITLIEK